jgi:hypothetical protein
MLSQRSTVIGTDTQQTPLPHQSNNQQHYIADKILSLPRGVRASIVCFTALFIIVGYFTVQQKENNIISTSQNLNIVESKEHETKLQQETKRKPKLADGCNSVYLDIGTNVGVQIRKLFEPHLYPDAPSLPYFEQSFGSEEERRQPGAVCVFGFEPGPWHTQRLDYIEKCYNSMNWKVKIFRVFGSNTDEGSSRLYRDANHENNDWASSEFKFSDFHGSGSESVEVKKMSIANFINEHVAGRLVNTVYKGTRKPYVLAKMDMEGSEYKTLMSMLFAGALCHVNKITIEWHDKFIGANIVDATEKAKYNDLSVIIPKLTNTYSADWTNCNHVQIEIFDEEYYNHDGKEFPPTCGPQPPIVG